MKLGPCIIPDEPVGKHVLEQVAVIKDPDGYTFEVRSRCPGIRGLLLVAVVFFFFVYF